MIPGTLWSHRDHEEDVASMTVRGDDDGLGIATLVASPGIYLDRDAAAGLRDALDRLLGDGPRPGRGEVDSRLRDVEHESFLRGFVEGQAQLVRSLELAVKLDERVVPLRTPGNAGAPSDDEMHDAVRAAQAAAARQLEDMAALIWSRTPAASDIEALAKVVRTLCGLLAEDLEKPGGAS